MTMNKFLFAVTAIVLLAGNAQASCYDEKLSDKENLTNCQKNAEQGDAQAQYNLGVMHDQGLIGVKQDYKRAVQWYRRAAEQGFAKAQYNLGIMYENGDGVIHDYVMAHMWLNIASSNGDEGAVGERNALAGKLSAAQINEAQKLAREWVVKH
jgi:TPR repeat protein